VSLPTSSTWRFCRIWSAEKSWRICYCIWKTECCWRNSTHGVQKQVIWYCTDGHVLPNRKLPSENSGFPNLSNSHPTLPASPGFR
jgi:hypothetical protein